MLTSFAGHATSWVVWAEEEQEALVVLAGGSQPRVDGEYDTVVQDT